MQESRAMVQQIIDRIESGVVDAPTARRERQNTRQAATTVSAEATHDIARCKVAGLIVSDFLATMMYKTLDEHDCPVCMNSIELEQFTLLKCGHLHWKSCVVQLSCCSVCRSST